MKKFAFLIVVLLGLTACETTSRRGNPEVEAAKLEFQLKNYQVAFEMLQPLAHEGDRDAQYALGYMYFYGIGIPQDTIKGRELIQAAAEKNQRMALKAIDIIAQHEASLASFPKEKTFRAEEK
jgi:TPR repeat protein